MDLLFNSCRAVQILGTILGHDITFFHDGDCYPPLDLSLELRIYPGGGGGNKNAKRGDEEGGVRAGEGG